MLEQRKQQIVRRAANLVGRNELAVRLKVTEARLDEWIGGQREVPNRTLFALVDILNRLAAEK